MKIIICIGILLLIGVAKYILINYSYVPEKSDFSVDLEKIRELAGAGKELPLNINSLFTGRGKLMKWTVAAGDKTAPNDYIQTSFQVVYENSSVIIDTPMGENLFRKFKYGKEFSRENYNLLQKAMKQTAILVFTHEHWDHTGGLAQSPYLNEIFRKAVLTTEQLNSPFIKKAEFPPGILRRIEPLTYHEYHKIAPGIIVIKAPGHTPGHQFIYVKLQDGKEFLFIGDTIWNFVNITKERARPLLVNFIGRENPKQVGEQILWLCNLHKNPAEKIQIIPSHDKDLIEDLIEQGKMGNTFTVNP